MSQSLHTGHEVHEGDVVVTARGELDMMTAAVLADELAAACQTVEAPDRLVMDLRGIEFLGTEGIACLLDAQRRWTDNGASCWIVANQRAVLRPLNALQLAGRFEIVDRVEHALPASSAQPMSPQPMN